MTISKLKVLVVFCSFILIIESKILPSKFEVDQEPEERSKNFKIYPNHRKEGNERYCSHLNSDQNI